MIHSGTLFLNLAAHGMREFPVEIEKEKQGNVQFCLADQMFKGH